MGILFKDQNSTAWYFLSCPWGTDLEGPLLLPPDILLGTTSFLQSRSSQPPQEITEQLELLTQPKWSQNCHVCHLFLPVTHMPYELPRGENCVCMCLVVLSIHSLASRNKKMGRIPTWEDYAKPLHGSPLTTNCIWGGGTKIL